VEIDGREFVLADIPGLIAGAHEGAGLGTRFLGHVERCRVLLHLIDGTGEDAGKDYATVRAELAAYGHELSEKPEIVALNKSDAMTRAQQKQQMLQLRRAIAASGRGDKHSPESKALVISAATGAGVSEALRALLAAIDNARSAQPEKRVIEAWHP
jgi:GTPase